MTVAVAKKNIADFVRELTPHLNQFCPPPAGTWLPTAPGSGDYWHYLVAGKHQLTFHYSGNNVIVGGLYPMSPTDSKLYPEQRPKAITLNSLRPIEANAQKLANCFVVPYLMAYEHGEAELSRETRRVDACRDLATELAHLHGNDRVRDGDHFHVFTESVRGKLRVDDEDSVHLELDHLTAEQARTILGMLPKYTL